MIRNTSFLNNFALSGGAIFINTLTTYTTIVDCLFTNNSATHFGGAIYALSDKDVIIRGTKFIDNFANISEGAIHVTFVKLFDSQFESNHAVHSGGAIHVYGNSIAGGAIISNSTFYFNQALGGDGGALYCKQSSIELHRGISEANSAVNGGFMHLLGCNAIIGDDFNVIGNMAT